MSSESAAFAAQLAREFPPNVLDGFTGDPEKEADDRMLQKCNEFYSRVKTYDDLLITNLAFFHNRFIPVFYYADKFASEDVSHQQSTQTLIDLHLRGFFTVNGQANTCAADEEQRPYVEAFLPIELIPLLQKKLSEMSSICFYQIELLTPRGPVLYVSTFEYTDSRTQKNPETGETSEESVITVTRNRQDINQSWFPVSARTQARLGANFYLYDAPRNIQKLLMSGNSGRYAYINIIMKEYCSQQLADALLLKIVKELNIPERMTDPFVSPAPLGALTGGYANAWFGVRSL